MYDVKQVNDIKFIGAERDSQHLNLSMVRFFYRGCEFLAQDIVDVLWFSTVQEAEAFCHKFGFEPVMTKTVYHVSGKVFWL